MREKRQAKKDNCGAKAHGDSRALLAIISSNLVMVWRYIIIQSRARPSVGGNYLCSLTMCWFSRLLAYQEIIKRLRM